MNIVKVNIADMNTVIAPDHIKTTGLGSCVGIILFDNVKHIAGLAHIMLPSSEIAKEESLNKAKYADTAIELLLKNIIKMGAIKRNISAKIAGGSQMFNFNSNNDLLKIGPRNVETTKRILKELEINIIAEDTGGNFGRTIDFDTATNILTVKTANQGTKEI